MRILTITYVLIGLLSIDSNLFCRAQGALRDNPSLIQKEPYTLLAETELYVLDGLFLRGSEAIPSDLEIIKTLKVKDSTMLKKMGIVPIHKSYTFYVSSPTSFHNYIYSITDFPSEMNGMNLPIIIDTKLITPDLYKKLSFEKKDKILKTRFCPKSELMKNKRIAFGAIIVETKK
jgi:hypothetical protein